jgi:hypothetical protein
MTRLEFYQNLCQPSIINCLGQRGFNGYLKKNKPKIFKYLSEKLGEDFSTQDLYCFLHNIDKPKCGHPKCKKDVKVKFSAGLYLFCGGHKCSLPLKIQEDSKQPGYAKTLIKEVRTLKEQSQSSGGFSNWL